jgi:hypothetical protein
MKSPSSSPDRAVSSSATSVLRCATAGRTPEIDHKQFLLHDIPSGRLLERLKPIERTLQGMGNQLQTVIEELRGREVSWARIGEALGISRQSAWERFA